MGKKLRKEVMALTLQFRITRRKDGGAIFHERELGLFVGTCLVPVFELVNISADEALLKVSVNDTRSLGSKKTLSDRPLANLVGAACEKTLHVECLVAKLDNQARRCST